MKHHFQTPRFSAPGGFTMVEIMVVVVIVSALVALMTPPLVSVMEANRLSQSGQGLLFRLSMARQMALTENKPLEIRFFRYADENGAEGFHAAQLFFFDEAKNRLDAVEVPFYFSTGVMISDSALSPLLAGTGQTAAEEMPPAEREPFKSLGAHYRKIIFYPNASTNITLPLREAYLTLCNTRATVVDATKPPPNFYTIQIDPVNGTTRTYRPE